MAPEHPFPIPTNDCFAVTKYVLESNDEFGDTNKTILAGDSAGGNIVMVMTQRLAKEKIKQPKMQVLIYPWTQMVIDFTFYCFNFDKILFFLSLSSLIINYHHTLVIKQYFKWVIRLFGILASLITNWHQWLLITIIHF